MDSFLLTAGTACWLGVLTSISPCPLATNIAAISYIGGKLERPRIVLFSGLLYILGRVVTYVVLGALIVSSALALSQLSLFLQRNMNKLIGPLLLLTGIVMLGIPLIKLNGPSFAQHFQQKKHSGVSVAFFMGLLFALSLCPVSAAIFFGSVIPLAVEHQSRIWLPLVYGIGTALPVVVFAFLVAFGARHIGGVFNKLSALEKWARKTTGIIFIVIGAYLCATALLGLSLL